MPHRAGFGNTGVNLNAASDTVLNNKTRSGPGVATATEQQQHFVKQMLQALANTDHEVSFDLVLTPKSYLYVIFDV